MSLWSDLPPQAQSLLTPLQTPLSAATVDPPTQVQDVDGFWTSRAAHIDIATLAGVTVDPTTGRLVSGGSGAPGPGTDIGTPIEFTGTAITVSYLRHLTGNGGAEDGGWAVDLDVPGIRVRLPYLRGAKLNPQGLLEFDPQNPVVKLIAPRLVVRTMQLSGASSPKTRLRSASTSGNPVDDVYTMISMSPPFAIIGPDKTVGFAFRSATLDLSSAAGPPDVPPGAFALPSDWQGFHLPMARLFVEPDGLSGIGIAAGVDNLWIGIGEHSGLTGTFSALVANDADPVVSVRIVTPDGRNLPVTHGATIAVPDRSVLIADANGGIAPITFALVVSGTAATPAGVDRTVLRLSPGDSKPVSVTVSDGNAHARTVNATVTHADAPTGPGSGASPTPARIANDTPERGSIVVLTDTATEVRLRMEPRQPATWTWDGLGAPITAEEVSVPVAVGATVHVHATPTAPPPANTVRLDAYFTRDHVTVGELPHATTNPDLISTVPATGPASFNPTARSFTSLAQERAADLAALQFTVDGWASYEASTTAQHNVDLSERRLKAVVAILKNLGYAAKPGTAHGHGPAHAHTPIPGETTAAAEGESPWWRAQAVATQPVPNRTVDVTLTRPEPTDPGTKPDPGSTLTPGSADPRPPERGRPACFRKIGVEVEIRRNSFVRCEIWGEFDIQTAAETQMARKGVNDIGPRTNPQDGIVTFRMRLRIPEDRASWDITAEFRAAAGDTDGLLRRVAASGAAGPGQMPPAAISAIGGVIVLGPLASAAAELAAPAGSVVQLGALALGGAQIISTKELTLYGGELLVSKGAVAPDGTTSSATGNQVSIMIDAETKVEFDIGIVRTRPGQPVTTRYKAVGIAMRWDEQPRPGDPSKIDYYPVAVFDPNKGYALEITPGSLTGPEPIGGLLRAFGLKISKTNPTYMEVEVGLGVPLGPVTVDNVGVRIRLDQAEIPQLSALGATLDIPGTIHGRGSVRISETGFSGDIDITITPLQIRGCASFAVATIDDGNPATEDVIGVLIGLDVSFPVPILLGNSGLGIFGFMGGVAINFARSEVTGSPTAAIDWMTQQFTPPRQGIMDTAGWHPEAGRYSFAGGILLGTAEGGYVLSLKGMLMIELPGPRILLMMKADVLMPPPILKKNTNASILAVLDLDFGRGTLTIGMVAQYEIKQILKVRVPVRAFFDTKRPENFLVDLGSYSDRVTVNVLDIISGSGYLMIHGNGMVPIEGLTVPTSGLTIATGFHIQAVLMGSKAVGLYLEVGAGFDAVLGFDPLYVSGRIYARGQLRLWIVSISASAELKVTVGTTRATVNGKVVETQHAYVKGEACGEVDFFFFSVKGCVHLEINSPPPTSTTPPDLVAGVTLVGRSPALVEGSGLIRSIDGAVGNAVEIGDAGDLPVVPLDSIPVVTFAAAPDDAGLTFEGTAPVRGSGVTGVGAWTLIGDTWWAYHVTKVELVGALTAGKRPSTFWRRALTLQPGEVPALALLSWLATPTPRAVAYGEKLDTEVTHAWGRVCEPVAPPTEVLWTFDACPPGPSPSGWDLVGMPWPDAGGLRSRAPRTGLHVGEPWRAAKPVEDEDDPSFITPARVVADVVDCPTFVRPEAGNLRSVWSSHVRPNGPTRMDSSLTSMTFTDVADQVGAGSLLDLPFAHQQAAVDHELLDLTCEGRVLLSPIQTGTKLDHTEDRLLDAVTITAQDDGFARFRVLLFAPLAMVRELGEVRFRNAAGDIVETRPITADDLVDGDHEVPETWLDAAGPWANPVERAGRLALALETDVYQFVLLDCEPPKEATSIEIGWLPKAAIFFKGRPALPFYVVAVSGVLRSEVARFDYDVTLRSQNISALSTALTQDASDHSLLTPNTTYEVAVTWESASVKGATAPTTAPAYAAPQTQRFRFRTEPATPPRDLTPWLLTSAPSPAEVAVFTREPMVLVLATQHVPELYAAYGYTLSVFVQASSGKHPKRSDTPEPGPATKIPISVGAYDAIRAPLTEAAILTPWEQKVREVLGEGSCVDTSGATSKHDILTFRYDFDPLTDYLLDVVAEKAGADPILVKRVPFTTGRFTGEDELAGYIGPTPPVHRLVRDLTPIGALPLRPTGAQLDAAAQAAGLPLLATPDLPRVEIWWTQAPNAPAQPVAVVIECSEPLVRERILPTVTTGPPDTDDPTHQWYAAARNPYLDVVTAGPPGAGEPPRASVTRTIVGPGGTRVIALLGPDSRSKSLALDLIRVAVPLVTTTAHRARVVDTVLTHAPWEVED